MYQKDLKINMMDIIEKICGLEYQKVYGKNETEIHSYIVWGELYSLTHWYTENVY